MGCDSKGATMSLEELAIVRYACLAEGFWARMLKAPDVVINFC